MLGLPPDKHLFLADTNPSDDGTKSWIYQVWFELANIDLTSPENIESLKNGPLRITPEQLKFMQFLQPLLQVVEFTLDDNTLIEPERIDQLKAMLASNPDLWARYVEGKWVTASLDALFINVFRPGVHVVGEIETPGNTNPMIMVPEAECFELYTGWDLGVTNSAGGIDRKSVGFEWPALVQGA